MAIGYWGYPNGDIPASAMYPVQSMGGTFYLREDAAYWWWRLTAEYGAVWGVPLEITDGYRPLAEQWYYWNAYQAGWGNVAAYPGTSNHGWACAVDIYTPSFGGSSSTPQHGWLRAHAPSFGWTWTTGKASGESWHWEFTESLPIPAGTNVTPIGDEIDMASREEIREDLKALLISPDFRTFLREQVSDIVTRDERPRLLGCTEHDGERILIDWDLPSDDPAKVAYPESENQIVSLGRKNRDFIGDKPEQARLGPHSWLETQIALARGTDPLFTPKGNFA